MINNCKNCKFYMANISESHGALPYGECQSSNMDARGFIKEKTTEGWEVAFSENNSQTKILTEGGYMEFQVGENFGCVHFKDKSILILEDKIKQLEDRLIEHINENKYNSHND